MREAEDATGSLLTLLEGSVSGRRFSCDELHTRDPLDGRPLLARYDLARAGGALDRSLRQPRSRGLWRWAPLLPVRQRSHVISLGEGCTPLLPVPRLASALGCPQLAVKAEGLNPTGSFKARGMTTAVSRAVELGARSFVVPSAGNAGAALAAYAAAAGADATVLMPVDAPPINQQEVLMCGARLLLVEGLIDDCARLAAELAEHTGVFNLSTLREPYRVEGKKTMGFELAEDGGWHLPDVIVYPTGGGTGVIGMWKAFSELAAVGLIGSARPRLVSVQAEGCAPIVEAFHRGENQAEPWHPATTRAAGLRVPSTIGDSLILDALRESGGTAVAVPEEAIDELQQLAGRLGAGYVSPETAAAFAAVHQLSTDGQLDRDDHVVVYDTGVGHKYPPPTDLAAPRPPVVQAAVEPEALAALVAPRG
jgi:threonine synthase